MLAALLRSRYRSSSTNLWNIGQELYSHSVDFQAVYAAAMILDASNLWNSLPLGDSKRMRTDEKAKPKVDLFKAPLSPFSCDAAYEVMNDRCAVELPRLLQLTEDDPTEAYLLARHHIEQMAASVHPHPDMPPGRHATREASVPTGGEK